MGIALIGCAACTTPPDDEPRISPSANLVITGLSPDTSNTVDLSYGFYVPVADDFLELTVIQQASEEGVSADDLALALDQNLRTAQARSGGILFGLTSELYSLQQEEARVSWRRWLPTGPPEPGVIFASNATQTGASLRALATPWAGETQFADAIACTYSGCEGVLQQFEEAAPETGFITIQVREARRQQRLPDGRQGYQLSDNALSVRLSGLGLPQAPWPLPAPSANGLIQSIQGLENLAASATVGEFQQRAAALFDRAGYPSHQVYSLNDEGIMLLGPLERIDPDTGGALSDPDYRFLDRKIPGSLADPAGYVRRLFTPDVRRWRIVAFILSPPEGTLVSRNERDGIVLEDMQNREETAIETPRSLEDVQIESASRLRVFVYDLTREAGDNVPLRMSRGSPNVGQHLLSAGIVEAR